MWLILGHMYLVSNLSIYPAYPSKSFIQTVNVSNSESCYVTSCQMYINVNFTNWVCIFMYGQHILLRHQLLLLLFKTTCGDWITKESLYPSVCPPVRPSVSLYLGPFVLTAFPILALILTRIGGFSNGLTQKFTSVSRLQTITLPPFYKSY